MKEIHKIVSLEDDDADVKSFFLEQDSPASKIFQEYRHAKSSFVLFDVIFSQSDTRGFY